jgi:hypothetical protein
MVIRHAQMRSMSDNANRTFEDRMVVHLTKCFPNQCRQQGEPKVREWIRYGIKRASEYGITAQRDTCKYIDLMFVYGREFDQDTNLPWASSILNDRALRDPTTKLETLYETGKQQQGGVRNRA